MKLLPISNSREYIHRRKSVRIPKIHENRLPRRFKTKPVGYGQLAVGVAVVFAEGKQRAMLLETAEHRLVSIMDCHLHLDRIGIDVDQTAGSALYRRRTPRPLQVQA